MKNKKARKKAVKQLRLFLSGIDHKINCAYERIKYLKTTKKIYNEQLNYLEQLTNNKE